MHRNRKKKTYLLCLKKPMKKQNSPLLMLKSNLKCITCQNSKRWKESKWNILKKCYKWMTHPYYYSLCYLPDWNCLYYLFSVSQNRQKRIDEEEEGRRGIQYYISWKTINKNIFSCITIVFGWLSRWSSFRIFNILFVYFYLW